MKSFRLHRGPRQPPDPVEEATQLIGLIGTLAVFTFIVGFAIATGIVMRQETWPGVSLIAGSALSLYTCWRIAAVRRKLRENVQAKGGDDHRGSE